MFRQNQWLPRLGLLLLIVFVPPVSARQQQQDEEARNWNNFRGPTHNGVSETATPPLEWSATRNVAWKTEIPGRGSSSPVVWNDRVFLTSAVNTESDDAPQPPRLTRDEILQKFDEDGDGQLSRTERAAASDFMRAEQQKLLKQHQFVVYCIDRNSGEILWQDVAATRKPSDRHHRDHGYASASPVTDGERVYFSFGSNGVYCYQLDGKKVWERTDLGEMQTRGSFGEGSSLALFEDVLILPWDHEGQSRINVLDKATGKTRWSVQRDEPTTWSTPQVVNVDGKNQIIQSGENYSRGYDLESGMELWRSTGLSTRPVATPVTRGNVGYFASSRRGAAVHAYYLNRQGDISSEAAWKIDRLAPDCPSLLLSDNRLYFLSKNSGIVSCANAEDGTMFFEGQRLNGISGVYSSPVAADGKVFITGRDGQTVVLQDAMEYKVLAQNDVGERVDATLALVDDQIFIRGERHLFCIQQSRSSE